MANLWMGRYRAYSVVWNEDGMGIFASARSEEEARSVTLLLYPQLEAVPLDIEDMTDDFMDNPYAPTLRDVLRLGYPGLIAFDEKWEEWVMEIPLDAWGSREPVETTQVESPSEPYEPPSVTMKELTKI